MYDDSIVYAMNPPAFSVIAVGVMLAGMTPPVAGTVPQRGTDADENGWVV